MADETPSVPPSEPSAPKPADPGNLQPYDLEPSAAPAPVPPTPPGKLSDKGLIDDMPEDADFDHDPEVEAALKGAKPKASKDDTVDEEAKPATPFVKAGLGDSKTIALVGAGITIAAVIAAAVNAPEHWFFAGVLALYFVIIHTI